MRCRQAGNSAAFIFGRCHIAPPIHRHGGLIGIGDPYAGHKNVFIKPEIHLIINAAHALKFIKAQYLFPVFALYFSRIHGRTGKRRMPDYAAVPFHAAGKPGVPNAQIAKADHIICIQNVLFMLFIVQLPEPAAEGRKKFGIQVLVFKHRHGQGLQYFVLIKILL